MSSALGGQPLTALRHSVRGCAYTRPRCGAEWASDWLDLVRLLVPVASNARAWGRDEMPLAAAELWMVFVGYLRGVGGLARKLYGARAGYTRAVEGWLGELLEGVNPALVATAGFGRKLRAAHARLLAWAGVEAEVVEDWVV